MINNYAKNNLLPPPVKKKYTKNHMLLLVLFTISKISSSSATLKNFCHPPWQERRFLGSSSALSLEDIYNEVFTLEMARLKNLTAKFPRILPYFLIHLT